MFRSSRMTLRCDGHRKDSVVASSPPSCLFVKDRAVHLNMFYVKTFSFGLVQMPTEFSSWWGGDQEGLEGTDGQPLAAYSP